MTLGVNGAVSFNYPEWAALFPELAYITQSQAQLYWGLANLYVDNTPPPPTAPAGPPAPLVWVCSVFWNNAGPIITDDSVGGSLDTLLNLATAHIAAVLSPAANGAAASTLVGRINAATTGSVNVSAEMNYPPGSASWWNQTKYGAMFWAATAQYRSFQYVAAPVRFAGFYR